MFGTAVPDCTSPSASLQEAHFRAGVLRCYFQIGGKPASIKGDAPDGIRDVAFLRSPSGAPFCR